ncbi:MAG: hypothetical protein AUH42_03475 [Gemmatimonadetes bacterium 13_1_40CM_70_11]|nr:MAG: hypothetical protein AUH42_03475 [Gemmatimonadetes bacterium 13_1_40CM_70_11]
MATTRPQLVVPFRGERFAAAESPSRLIAPPYDVITPPERARLAASDSHNIVHLILPEAPAGEDRYARAAELLATWRRDGVLAADAAPAVYVLAQEYQTPGDSGEWRTRTGMFAAVAAEPYETGRVRPHERTHSSPKADRLALLRAARTSLESIFLLAPDPDGALLAGLRQVTTQPPVARAELENVRMNLWVVGATDATRLAQLASRAPLYIADGHHRYETAVAYARETPQADRVLSFIVSAADPGLTVLPTHRVIFAPGRNMMQLVTRWRRWFDVGRVAPCADRLGRLAELGARSGATACLVALPGGDDLTLVLRPDAPLAEVPELGRTPAVRALDVAIVETLVVQEILSAGTSTPTLTYTADARAAFEAVRKGNATSAVLLNPTKVEQVFAVADAGDVMPPKSTYFAPKVPSGLVLRPLS